MGEAKDRIVDMHAKAITLTRILPMVLAGFCTGAAGQMLHYDPKVEKALERGRRFILKSQTGDHWPPYGKGGKHGQTCGPTGLAVYALMESGMNPQSPKIAAALQWLTEQKEGMTYSLACRMLAYAAAERTQPGKYREFLAKDAKQLWTSMNGGRIHYLAPGRPEKPRSKKGKSARAPKPRGGGGFDNSNTQFALLGLWAASERGVEIPTSFWKESLIHWRGCQNRDGGWGYRGRSEKGGSRGTMSASGLASLFVCNDKLFMGEYVKCGRGRLDKHTAAGLRWFEKGFATGLGGTMAAWANYYLYGVERVALASGYKYFGGHDWYKEGTAHLLRTQGGNGSWSGQRWKIAVPNTAFAVLFLTRGRHPVVFNKLHYDGDWNNRPRALARLTQWIGRTFEKTVNWQIIDINRPVREWHDAPILVITGAEAPKFSDGELAKLRLFVRQGGTLLSIRECKGEGFGKGIREVYRKLFPEYELTVCGPSHPIYHKAVYFSLPASLRVHQISNGVRPLVLHVDTDTVVSWQLGQVSTKKAHFELAFNVIKYVADGLKYLRHRGISHWPTPGGSVERTVAVARLRHTGNYDPEPQAYARLAALMRRFAGTRLEVKGPIPIADLPGAGVKVASLTGTGTLSLTADEKAALVKFVRGGGTLLVDAAGGNKPFADSSLTMLRGMFPGVFPERLSRSHSLFAAGGEPIERFLYRRRTRIVSGPGSPRVRAFTIGGRPAVIHSAEDLTAGLLGTNGYTIAGYAPETAWQIVRNVILHAAK
jgi:hypothetical protein